MGIKADRRQWIGGALATTFGAAFGGTARAQPRPPNIVFIMADDLGYADLSCYGRRDYQTTVIDQLAASGVQLLHGYANSCVCSPTRVALITGRYQYRLRVGLEEPIARSGERVALPDGYPTLPSLMKRAGYRTALIGKWHAGQSGPNSFGYDHFFGFAEGGTNYYQQPTDATGLPNTWLLNGRPIQRPGYLTDLLGDEAVRWIGKGGALPFFLSLHFSAPHWPWVAPGDTNAAAGWSDIYDVRRGSLEIYARMVENLDQNVGKVLAALDRLALADNTIVVFTSDNGGERFSDTWPFTGMKGELLEGGIRVPLIVRWPQRIRPRVEFEQVMTSMDFLPTLLAAAGAAPDRSMPSDGENLLPVLTGEAAPRDRRLFWRFRNADQAAVRDGRFKYLKLAEREYLFDLVLDPRERANLKDADPNRFRLLKEAFATWNARMLSYPAEAYSYDPRDAAPDRH